jgi:poly(beta-D-mannuronate) lyase
MNRAFFILVTLAAAVSISAISSAKSDNVPADKFDLSQWKIQLPLDKNKDGKADEVDVKKLQKFSHPDFFYLDENGGMVFASPNKATTTKNTSNSRSELREMLRGTHIKTKTKSAKNNWAVEARKDSDKFGRVGGRLDATLKVDHVATRAGDAATRAAYSVVVGQIHADKYKNTSSGFGFGNEPIKVYYKKFPDHKTGSVFWNYERNLPKDDDNRTDISHAVFGYDWNNTSDPGTLGVALGEEFSYTINVHKNTMYLTFSNDRLGTKAFTKSLVSQLSADGTMDPLDNKFSYGGDTLYFKAGVYNQCSPKKGGGDWYAGCPGTGDWAVDKANGDYAQATFRELTVGPSTPPVR